MSDILNLQALELDGVNLYEPPAISCSSCDSGSCNG